MVYYMKTILTILLMLTTYTCYAAYQPFPGVVSTSTHEGETSILVSPGPADIEIVHIDAEDVAVETAFMIIDLSDTVFWSHVNTGHIDLVFATMNVDPDTNYFGDIKIGFLTSADATDADFHGIFELHLDKKSEPLTVNVPMPFGGIPLQLGHWFGPTTTDSTLFQTDVNLAGPNDATSFPSASGDLVMIVGRTAGEVSVGLTIGYVTKAN